MAIALLGCSTGVPAEPELRVDLRMAQIGETETRDLGTVKVKGVGEVKLIARRKGIVIVLTAIGPDGTPIGRAEATVGLSESPIHVRTPDGMTKISVLWRSPG